MRLKNRIQKPYDTTAAVYRITIRKDDDAATTFSQDSRQEVKKVQGNAFELHVKASKDSGGEVHAKDAGFRIHPKFVFYHQCRSEGQGAGEAGRQRRNRSLAKGAADRELGSRQHEGHCIMKRWRRPIMSARNLEGDCTEYSMLTAAMCRAEGRAKPNRHWLNLRRAVGSQSGAVFCVPHVDGSVDQGALDSD